MPHPKKQVSIVCIGCGCTFSVKASTAALGRKWCTKQCRSKHVAALFQCRHCGRKFKDYKCAHPKYCSISCGVSARNLTSQNPSYSRDVSGSKNPMYGKRKSGADNPMYGKTGPLNPAWRGGRKIRKDGYVLVTAPANHPYAISSGPGKSRYILEHRYVMEQCLGRFLEPAEVVHHIDGNPRNNRPENLELFASQSDHIANGHG